MASRKVQHAVRAALGQFNFDNPFSDSDDMSSAQKLQQCSYQCRTDAWGNLMDAVACNDCLTALQSQSSSFWNW